MISTNIVEYVCSSAHIRTSRIRSIVRMYVRNVSTVLYGSFDESIYVRSYVPELHIRTPVLYNAMLMQTFRLVDYCIHS